MVELINSQNNDKWCQCLLITSQKFTFVNLEVIWTNLNLPMSESFHVKLIWRILAEWFSRRKFFNDLTKVLHFCDYLPFLQFWNPFTQRWFVPCLIEIGPLVLEKICFSTCHVIIMVFLLWPIPTPGDLDLKNF
jgi:hypothetical protein